MGAPKLNTAFPVATPESMTLCPLRNLEESVSGRTWMVTERRVIPRASPRRTLSTRSLTVRRPASDRPVLRTTPASTTVGVGRERDRDNDNHGTMRQTYHNPAPALPLLKVVRQQGPPNPPGKTGCLHSGPPSLCQLGVVTRN